MKTGNTIVKANHVFLYVLVEVHCLVYCIVLVSTVLDSAHCVHYVWNSMFQTSCLFMPEMGSRILQQAPLVASCVLALHFWLTS